jgi:hypothetical protein
LPEASIYATSSWIYDMLKNPMYINRMKEVLLTQGYNQQQIALEMTFIQNMSLEKLKAELANESSPFTVSLVQSAEKSFAQGFQQGFQSGFQYGFQQTFAATNIRYFAGRSNPGQEGKLNGFTLYFNSNQTYREKKMTAEIAKDVHPADVSDPSPRAFR